MEGADTLAFQERAEGVGSSLTQVDPSLGLRAGKKLGYQRLGGSREKHAPREVDAPRACLTQDLAALLQDVKLYVCWAPRWVFQVNCFLRRFRALVVRTVCLCR